MPSQVWKRALRGVRQWAQRRRRGRPFGRDLCPRLQVYELEPRRVLSGMPAAWITASQELVISAGSQADDGQADSFVVLREGDRVSVAVNGEEAYSGTSGDFSKILVKGSGDDDTLTIDYSGGDPLPGGGLVFNGNGHAQGSADTLILDAGSLGASVDTLTQRFEGAESGSIRLTFGGETDADSSWISYTQVGSIQEAVEADHVVFQSDLGGQTLFLGDNGVSGDGISTIRISDGVQVAFQAPRESLTIETSSQPQAAGDVVTLDSLDVGPGVDLRIRGDADDAVTVSGTLDLGGGDLLVESGSISVEGTITAGNVTLDAGPTGTLVVSGTIDASNLEPGQEGGEVRLCGEHLEWTDSARIEAGTLVVDPATITIDAGYAAWIVTELNFTDVEIVADEAIYVQALVDASGATGSHSLTLTAPIIVFSDGADLLTGQGDLVLDGDVTLEDGAIVTLSTSGGSGAIDIVGTVSGSAGGLAEELTVLSGAGTIWFEDAVGGTAAIDTLFVESESGDILIDGTIDGAQSVTLNTSGITYLNAAIGGATPIGTLMTDAGGITRLGAAITACGGTLIFDDAVELTADTTLIDTGTTGIFFNSTLDGDGNGPWSLTLQTTDPDARIEFNDAVGASQPLNDLTITNAGALVIAADADMTLAGTFLQDGDGAVQTAGDITAQGSVTFTSAITLTDSVAIGSATGDIVFLDTVDGTTEGVEDLTLTADSGSITFHAAVGDDTALGAILITTAVDVEAFDAITAASFVQSAGDGTTTLYADVTTSASEGIDLTTDRVVLDWIHLTAGGDGGVRFDAPVELAGPVEIDAGGAIRFENTVVSPGGEAASLILNTPDDVVFLDAVGYGADNALGAITIQSADFVDADSTITAASLVQCAGTGTTTLRGDVTTSAAEGVDLTASEIVLEEISILAAGGGIVRFDGPVDLAGSVEIDAEGTITFESTLTSSGGPQALTLTSDADVEFNGNVGAGAGNELGAITIVSAVAVTANGTIRAASFVQEAGSGVTTLFDDVTTSDPAGIDISTAKVVLDGLTLTASGEGVVRFDAPVDLTGAVWGVAGGGITFEQAVVSSGNAAETLTLASGGNIEFHGAVGAGAGNQLGAITITTAVDVTADSTIEAASLVQEAGSGTTTLTGDVTTSEFEGVDLTASRIALDSLSIRAAGGGIVRLGGLVDLLGPADIDADGTITFEEAVVSSGGGEAPLTLVSGEDILFVGAVGTGADNALGAITITDAVDVTFDSVVVAASLVQVAGRGTTTLHGSVTTTDAEGVNLTASEIVLDGLSIQTTGDGIVRFNGPVDLTGSVEIDAEGSITFEDVVISSDSAARDLTLASGDSITFKAAVGAGPDSQLGAITITSAVDVTAESTIDAASLVQLAGSGTTTLRDDVTTTAAKGIDITADEWIVLDGLNLKTTGGGIVRFGGPVDLTGDVDIAAEGTITFDDIVISSGGRAQAITLASDANIVFKDAVGDDADGDLDAITITTAVDVTAESTISAASLVQQAGSGTTTLRGDVTTTAVRGLDLTANQIVLDGEDAGGLSLVNTAAGTVRLNGPVRLASDVLIDAADGLILFTTAATIDGEVGESNDLTLSAGDGSVSFNADIGDTQAIGNLTVTEAGAGVTFGGTGGPDYGVVGSVRTDGEINLGSEDVIGGKIALNAGDGDMILFTTSGDRVRFNGAVELQSDVFIDTGLIDPNDPDSPAGAEIRFTLDAPIDSQDGERNDLILSAGADGTVSFNADIGADVALGQLIVTEAKGVAFGNDPDAADPDLAPITTVQVDGDPDPLNQDDFDINLGSVTAIGEDGITFNAGDGDVLSLVTTGDRVRFNGAVELQSDVLIDTDGGSGLGAEIRFTLNATIDSQAAENNDLTLTAGTDGIVSFNADIGTNAALGQLIVTDAYGVEFGHDPGSADPDLDTMTTVRVDGDLDPLNLDDFDINLGSEGAIGPGGIRLDAGDGETISLVTTGDRVRFNGEVELRSDVLVDTTDEGNSTGAEIRFTVDAPINSQGGENNDLTLTAGTNGIVSFNADLGATFALGQLIVTEAKGVAFGNDPGADPDLGEVSVVRVDGDPLDPDAYGIDIGSLAAIGSDGITLNAGPGGEIAFTTTADRIHFNGAVTLRSDARVDTTDAGAAAEGADILIEGAIDGTSGDPAENLTLISHNGSITVTGTIGGSVPLGTLSLQDDEPDSTGSAVFQSAVHVTALETFGQPYAVEFLGGGSVTEAVEFLNTGGVTLGDTVDDEFTFGNGVTSVESETSIGGTIRTLNANIDFATVWVLADARLFTAGGDITFEGTVDSEEAEQNTLELTAGSGKVEFQGDVGAQWGLNQLVVHTAGEVLLGSDASPVQVVHAAGGIDLGQDSAIAGGIHLNGGDDDLLVMSTAGGEVRLNGAVTLESHVQIDTSDGGGAAGGEIRFTRNAPVDSESGENNVLTLSAGTDGTVNFNANLGASVALGQLIVTEAAGVVFGNDPSAAYPDFGLVTTVRVDGGDDPDEFAINLGSDTEIGDGGITLNGGDGGTISFITTADAVRLNGATVFESHVLIDTTDEGRAGSEEGAEIRFTRYATIDSAADESNRLTLTAGTEGIVSFNGDIGVDRPLGQLVVTDAYGVVFGGETPEEEAPITTVRVGGGSLLPGEYGINLGSHTAIGDGGIVLNAGKELSGESLTLTLATAGEAVRFNGAVELQSHAAVDTTDSGQPGAAIRFTANAPVDSQAGEHNDLTLTAGVGLVEFNADLGADVALGRLEVTQADAGVVFGGWDEVLGDQGPVHVVNAERGIDLGSLAVIEGGIVLNAGPVDEDEPFEMTTAGGDIRFNGPVTLASHVLITAGDAPSGTILFTDESPIDSAPGEKNNFVLNASAGGIAFNADLGARESLNWFEIVQADAGVVFGQADSPEGPLGDRGPVRMVNVETGISLGSEEVIFGGIVLNAGPGEELVIHVASGGVDVNGPVWLESDVGIDTFSGDGDITFTMDATIDSQLGEHNDLRLNAGLGGVFFEGDIGGAAGGDHTLGDMTIESSGEINTACYVIWAFGDILWNSSGDITIAEMGESEVVGNTVEVYADGLFIVESGASVASITGRASNFPPLLRLDPVDPDTAIGLYDRVQHVTGTFGGDEDEGDNLELGENFTLIVLWDDGIETTIHGIHAGDEVVLFVDEQGNATYTITHVEDTGPVHISLAREYTIAHLITVPDFVHAKVTIDNDYNIFADDMRAEDLNSVNDDSATRVATEQLRYAEPSPAFVPPAPFQTPEAVVTPPETHVPTGIVNLIDEIRPPSEATVAKWRLIYLVRVLPHGAETDPYLLPDDALNDLVKLFDRFREEGLPNGRYRIYLKEVGFPARRVIEFYKSGNTFGDPVHEPGPGSNPVPQDQSAPSPKHDRAVPTPKHPPSAIQEGHSPVRDGQSVASLARPIALQDSVSESIPLLPAEAEGATEDLPSTPSGSDRGGSDGFAVLGNSPRRLSKPLIGALAASLTALAQQVANDRWATRVDRALEGSSDRGLSRYARLRRLRTPRGAEEGIRGSGVPISENRPVNTRR